MKEELWSNFGHAYNECTTHNINEMKAQKLLNLNQCILKNYEVGDLGEKDSLVVRLMVVWLPNKKEVRYYKVICHNKGVVNEPCVIYDNKVIGLDYQSGEIAVIDLSLNTNGTYHHFVYMDSYCLVKRSALVFDLPDFRVDNNAGIILANNKTDFLTAFANMLEKGNDAINLTRDIHNVLVDKLIKFSNSYNISDIIGFLNSDIILEKKYANFLIESLFNKQYNKKRVKLNPFILLCTPAFLMHKSNKLFVYSALKALIHNSKDSKHKVVESYCKARCSKDNTEANKLYNYLMCVVSPNFKRAYNNYKVCPVIKINSNKAKD